MLQDVGSNIATPLSSARQAHLSKSRGPPSRRVLGQLFHPVRGGWSCPWATPQRVAGH